MWTRAELKTRAKNVLRKNYWRAFIVSLVILISGAGYSSSSNYVWKNSNISIGSVGSQASNIIYGSKNAVSRTAYKVSNALNRVANRSMNVINTYAYRTASDIGLVRTRAWDTISSANIINPMTVILGFGLMLFGFFALFFRIIVGYGLEVGSRRYFINAADNPNTGFEPIGLAFKNGNYLNVVCAMLRKSLYVFLWSLLFIIPGIVKGFSYSMLPYILADNPKLAPSRAIEISDKITYGHKWEMFVLNLSFIGWYILGGLCFGIGVVFVHPYENTTKAELYLTLRNKALDSGMIKCEELCLTPVLDYVDMTDPYDDRQN